MRGHVFRFCKQAGAKDPENKRADTSEEEEEREDIIQVPTQASEDASHIFLSATSRTANRYTGDYKDLDELLYHTAKVVKPKSSDIMVWLTEIYKTSRGFELGTYDCSIVPIIWKQQTANWNDIALGYISDIICIVHRFHSDMIRSCCSDERVLAGVNSVLSEHLIQRYWRAINHVKFVLYTERDGTPLTANHYFADNLEKWYA